MVTNLPSCYFIHVLEQLLKFLVNFTLLKYVKSQRSYGFLITKEPIFGFQILDLKDHFSASLRYFSRAKNLKRLVSVWSCNNLCSFLFLSSILCCQEKGFDKTLCVSPSTYRGSNHIRFAESGKEVLQIQQ